jgi:hypothetical protein
MSGIMKKISEAVAGPTVIDATRDQAEGKPTIDILKTGDAQQIKTAIIKRNGGKEWDDIPHSERYP